MRKKVPQAPTLYDNKPQYTSEPHLTDEADTPPQPVRRGSQRRTAPSNSSTYAPGEFTRHISRLMFHYSALSTARRKSNASSAFLDVPGANFYNSRINDNNDDTVTLRTFSSSNKGELEAAKRFSVRSITSYNWKHRADALRNNFINNKFIKIIRLGIVNRGDSFRRRRSRSSSLIPPASPMKTPDDARSSTQNIPSDSYLVAMLGAPGVGKCALLSQFRTSECINAYETGRGKLQTLFQWCDGVWSKDKLSSSSFTDNLFEKVVNWRGLVKLSLQWLMNRPLFVPINFWANWILRSNALRPGQLFFAKPIYRLALQERRWFDFCCEPMAMAKSFQPIFFHPR